MATSKVARRYDRIAWLYALPWEPRAFTQLRPGLVAGIEGDVLEVGVGTGANLPYYPPDARLTAIDISPKMLSRAVKKAREVGREADLCVMDVGNMAFPDEAFDFVVSTLVFCSVEDPSQGLREVRRVLKRDGEFRLLEHVRSERPLLGPMMDLLNPLTRFIGDNINRRTVEDLEAAGFELLSVEPKGGQILKEIRAKRIES
jgi:ubiquinone/menaquinone biosynthesis C-methylase UbiE